VVKTLGRLQEAFDLAPDIVSDHRNPTRVAVQKFALTQQCSSLTASFYVWSFGGLRGEMMDQAVAEFEASGKRDAPIGFCEPGGTHWLISLGNVLAGLGGQCVATLCSGLKNELEFEVGLFAGSADSSAPSKLREILHADANANAIQSLRQRWIGFSSTELQETEDTVCLVMLACNGLFAQSNAAHVAVDIAGCLLHAGRQALQVKRKLQDEYRLAKAAGTAQTWNTICKQVMDKVTMLLEYCGSFSGAAVPVLQFTDDVFQWHSEHAITDSRCAKMDRITQFLQMKLTASEVRHILDARRQAVQEAELGYTSAVALLETGAVQSSGLQRISTEQKGNLVTRRGKNDTEETTNLVRDGVVWKVDLLSESEAQTQSARYTLWWKGNLIFGCGATVESGSKKIRVLGWAVEEKGDHQDGSETTKVMWTEVDTESKTVVARFEGAVMTWAGEWTLSGELQSVAEHSSSGAQEQASKCWSVSGKRLAVVDPPPLSHGQLFHHQGLRCVLVSLALSSCCMSKPKSALAVGHQYDSSTDQSTRSSVQGVS
jgi:hypothetical protein